MQVSLLPDAATRFRSEIVAGNHKACLAGARIFCALLKTMREPEYPVDARFFTVDEECYFLIVGHSRLRTVPVRLCGPLRDDQHEHKASRDESGFIVDGFRMFRERRASPEASTPFHAHAHTQDVSGYIRK